MQGSGTSLEYDIFISYAHIDDTPLMDEEVGWISEFCKTLDTRMQQIAGEKFNVYWDSKLQGNDIFDNTLVKMLSKAAVLVSVLSPRYVKSEWCLRELELFTQAAEANGGIRKGNKSRIFKVLKTYVPREMHPPPLDHLLGYEFYELDPDTGRPQEYRVEFGVEAKLNYLKKLNELAYEIAEMLKNIKETGASESERPNTTSETVFLAETTADLSEQRDQVKAELRQLGHTVLPEQAFPIEGEKLADMVSADLKRSKLVVHFVGSNYSFIPEGERRSVLRLQNDLAAAQSQSRGLLRLIWIPKNAKPRDKKQQQLIDHLQKNESSMQGADLLNSGIEELKTTIRDRLKGKPEFALQTAIEIKLIRIYVIYDRRDFEAAKPMSDYLYSQGFEVLKPVFEGDEAEVREDHADKLVYSDAILICYGVANEMWLSSKLRELRKLPGYESYKPKLSTAIYVTMPVSPAKEQLKSREALVLKSCVEFSPSIIQPFVDAIQSASGMAR